MGEKDREMDIVRRKKAERKYKRALRQRDENYEQKKSDLKTDYALARIHRRTRMDGVKTAEWG